MSFPVSIVAVVWIAFISIVFILPELNPVDSQTLNYAIVAVGIVITYSMGFWFLSARKWFTGPVKQIEGTYLLLSILFRVVVLMLDCCFFVSCSCFCYCSRVERYRYHKSGGDGGEG